MLVNKALRLLVLACLILTLALPLSGMALAQGSDCDLANGALIGTLSYGINCLDANGWNTFEVQTSGLPVTSISDVAICPDDKSLVLVNIFGMNKFDGSAWSEIDVDSSVVAPKALACAPGGEVWATHISGVSHFDGSAWTTTDSKQLGSSPFIIGANDIAASAEGSVWITTSGSIVRAVDNELIVFENGKGLDQDYSLGDIALTAEGLPVAVYNDGILTFDGENWSSNQAPISLLQKVIVDNAGRIWVGSMSEGVAVFADGNWTVYNVESGLSSNSIKALASDSRGRVWVGTEWGLNVLDGETWSVYQMGNSDLLDNNVQQLTILGEGPALPELVEKAPGSVTGVLVNGRDPAPNLQVELCTASVGGMFYGATPCEGQSGQMLTTTNEEGEFTFENVPIGRYDMTFETADGWIYFIGADTKVEVAEGQANDLAFIDISG
jgi:sugar lactone lactonase YvrE